MIDVADTNVAAMTRLPLKSRIYQDLVAQLEAVSMTPGVHHELSALVTHPLQGWRDRLMIVQMSEAKAKVLACLTDPLEIHRRDLQKRLTVAVRHRPSDDEVCELFVARLKLVSPGNRSPWTPKLARRELSI